VTTSEKRERAKRVRARFLLKHFFAPSAGLRPASGQKPVRETRSVSRSEETLRVSSATKKTFVASAGWLRQPPVAPRPVREPKARAGSETALPSRAARSLRSLAVYGFARVLRTARSPMLVSRLNRRSLRCNRERAKRVSGREADRSEAEGALAVFGADFSKRGRGAAPHRKKVQAKEC